MATTSQGWRALVRGNALGENRSDMDHLRRILHNEVRTAAKPRASIT
jgi:hypothetical protein